MQETQDKIVEYIKEKYRPLAIILHGSQANGMAREHSDWDIAMVVKEEVDSHREIAFGANIEYKQIIYPVPEHKFLSFAIRTDNTKILYDTDDIGKSIIKQNDAIIAKGNGFTPAQAEGRFAFLTSALGGIEDYSDNTLSLFDKKIDFYTRATDAWFKFIKREYQPSGYVAYPKMEKEDAVFYELIKEFVKQDDSRELVQIGNRIIQHIFPDLS